MPGRSDLIAAITCGDLDTVARSNADQINMRDSDDRTPLMLAVLLTPPNVQIVSTLISRGADVNAAEQWQCWTALHFAARDNQYDLVRALIKAGANLDPVDTFGDTPLWRSVMNCGSNLSTVRLLLDHGADPLKLNDNGVSALDIARESGRGDLVELLQLYRRT